MDAQSKFEELSQALEGFDDRRAEALVVELLRGIWLGQVPETTGLMTAKKLRDHRLFFSLAQVAGALLAVGVQDVRIKVALAQGMIDSDHLSAAGTLLDGFLREDPTDAELLALRGRVHKQLFVGAVSSGAGPADAAPFLRQSFASYHEVYDRDSEAVYQGINAVALAIRAERDRIALQHAFDARAAAKAIYSLVVQRVEAGQADEWDYAIAMESALALGRRDDVLVAGTLYLTRGKNAFAFAGTLRQLREIWCLDERDPYYGALTGMLAAKITVSRQGLALPICSVHAQPDPQAAAHDVQEAFKSSHIAASFRAAQRGANHFEAVFNGLLVPMSSLQQGMQCARSVAWIARPNGAKHGTGFLLPGMWLDPELGTEPVLLTNSHVVDDVVSTTCDALHPASARIGFEIGENCDKVFTTAHTLLWRSAPEDLDAVVVRLQPTPAQPLHELAQRLPNPHGANHVFIIGHAGGRELSYSLMDNLLLDADQRVLHYRAPTQPGSSGSPVFNMDWELLAIHHRGLNEMPRLNGRPGTYQANEGISIEALRAAIQRARP